MCLLLLPFLYGNFVQKWYIPQGISGFGNTTMQIVDTDQDGRLELIFTTYGSWPPYIYLYELHPPDTWQVDSIPLIGGDLLWDAGDFDDDGFYDLALQFHIESPGLADGIMVFESPDSFSYPTQEVWRDTVGFALVTPICVHDIDQDGLPEVVKVIGDTTDIDIYESVGDNLYDRTFRFTSAATHAPMSTIAFGDFDMDGQREFIFGYSGGEYSILECTGDNYYGEILLGELPTLNIQDCFCVPDADGDGKPEFVVKGFVIPTAQIDAFIFEATGDNTYEIITTFTLPGGDYYGGYSDAGDVDGDDIPEIALEGRQTVHIIKAAGNDSFYVWETLPGNTGGSSVRVFDVDGNGLSEVVISGNNQTRIYEYEVGIAEDDESTSLMAAFEVRPNPFRNILNIRLRTQTKGEMTVNVYDVSGRLTKTLYSGSFDGSRTLMWQGDDNNGIQVPPGVYFVRFEHFDLQRVFCSKITKMR